MMINVYLVVSTTFPTLLLELYIHYTILTVTLRINTIVPILKRRKYTQ